MNQVGDVLKFLVDDHVMKDKLMWEKINQPSDVKASEMVIFTSSFIDAYAIDRVTLNKMMQKAMSDARQRVRVDNSRKKRKSGDP